MIKKIGLVLFVAFLVAIPAALFNWGGFGDALRAGLTAPRTSAQSSNQTGTPAATVNATATASGTITATAVITPSYMTAADIAWLDARYASVKDMKALTAAFDKRLIYLETVSDAHSDEIDALKKVNEEIKAALDKKASIEDLAKLATAMVKLNDAINQKFEDCGCAGNRIPPLPKLTCATCCTTCPSGSGGTGGRGGDGGKGGDGGSGTGSGGSSVGDVSGGSSTIGNTSGGNATGGAGGTGTGGNAQTGAVYVTVNPQVTVDISDYLEVQFTLSLLALDSDDEDFCKLCRLVPDICARYFPDRSWRCLLEMPSATPPVDPGDPDPSATPRPSATRRPGDPTSPPPPTQIIIDPPPTATARPEFTPIPTVPPTGECRNGYPLAGNVNKAKDTSNRWYPAQNHVWTCSGRWYAWEQPRNRAAFSVGIDISPGYNYVASVNLCRICIDEAHNGLGCAGASKKPLNGEVFTIVTNNGAPAWGVMECDADPGAGGEINVTNDTAPPSRPTPGVQECPGGNQPTQFWAVMDDGARTPAQYYSQWDCAGKRLWMPSWDAVKPDSTKRCFHISGMPLKAGNWRFGGTEMELWIDGTYRGEGSNLLDFSIDHDVTIEVRTRYCNPDGTNQAVGFEITSR